MNAEWRTILVDDDPAVRTLVRALLAEDGRYEVVGEAVDGEAGVAQALVSEPDLVLLDMAMPGLDGLEFLVELRERSVGPLPTVVVLTGFSDPQTAEAARAHGARACLTKNDLVRTLLPGLAAALFGLTPSHGSAASA